MHSSIFAAKLAYDFFNALEQNKGKMSNVTG